MLVKPVVLATGRLAYGTGTTVPARKIELAEAEKSLLAESRAHVAYPAKSATKCRRNEFNTQGRRGSATTKSLARGERAAETAEKLHTPRDEYRRRGSVARWKKC